MRIDPGPVVRRAVLQAVQSAMRGSDAPLLLAVSGGLDSMVLLHVMADVARERIAAVATFDHRTGRASLEAAEHVREAASGHGLETVTGLLDPAERVTDGREAAWRRSRWRFLSREAERLGARVATAHTEDDQVETLLMRIMRGSGARGLAGLYAESAIVRPFLKLRRETIASLAALEHVEWVEDPTNVSRNFFRNRVRHDLLPAMRGADPDIDDTLLELAGRASHWRADVEAFVTEHVRPELRASGDLLVPVSALAGFDQSSLTVLWSALAGRAGVALDWRGTRRIAEFTRRGARDGTMPLSGGWCVEATRDAYIIKRSEASPPPAASLPQGGALHWGRFRFRVSIAVLPGSLWTAVIPEATGGLVRVWGAGDRLAPAAGQQQRRVTRYLSDAGLRGGERQGWPVVLAGSEVVWIPGVRRSDAATDRSGRPVRHYVCERIDR